MLWNVADYLIEADRSSLDRLAKYLGITVNPIWDSAQVIRRINLVLKKAGDITSTSSGVDTNGRSEA